MIGKPLEGVKGGLMQRKIAYCAEELTMWKLRTCNQPVTSFGLRSHHILR